MYTDEKQSKSSEEHEISRATTAAKILKIEYLKSYVPVPWRYLAYNNCKTKVARCTIKT